MIVFVSDMFVSDYVGGAELTTEAIITSCLMPNARVHSRKLTVQFMRQHKNAFWIFGNFYDLSLPCLLYAIKNLNYSALEYDYKFCMYRSPEKHVLAEKSCNCENTSRGKAVSLFLNSSKMTWWMSRQQGERYKKWFPFLNGNNRVLNSVFSKDTLDLIENLDTSNKSDKYIILNSKSWIKGLEDSVRHAEQNGLDYELAWGLEYKQLLEKLAKSKGLIFFPRAGDTCPRITIEAKLLNCELILNENVQHREESWFKTREACLTHMRSRTSVFWSTIENLWHLNTPKDNSIEERTSTFRIVVPFYNAEDWISKCISSVKRQHDSKFKCYLVDDLSVDNSYDVAKLLIGGDDRFELIRNSTKRYALGNIAEVLNTADCNPEDIVVILDGDDWLSAGNVLSHLRKVYSDKKCFMTYGSYVYHPGGSLGVEPSEYPKTVIETNSFRKDTWRASHLRTFKYFLWQKIDQKDLMEQGGYYKAAYDQALMLPLLEMSAERSEFIPEIMLVYNRENPLNVDKIKEKIQYSIAQKVRKQKPYQRIS